MVKPNIALVDDESELVEAFKELLEDKYDIVGFSSADEYLLHIRKLQRNPFKVVITDYNLGGVNGLDMIEKAKAIDKNTAFILISGFLDTKTTQHAFDIGAFSILEKPIKVEALEQNIHDILSTQTLK